MSNRLHPSMFTTSILPFLILWRGNCTRSPGVTAVNNCWCVYVRHRNIACGRRLGGEVLVFLSFVSLGLVPTHEKRLSMFWNLNGAVRLRCPKSQTTLVDTGSVPPQSHWYFATRVVGSKLSRRHNRRSFSKHEMNYVTIYPLISSGILLCGLWKLYPNLNALKYISVCLFVNSQFFHSCLFAHWGNCPIKRLPNERLVNWFECLCFYLPDSQQHYRYISDVDECQLGYCEEGTCENTAGGFVCHCPVNFLLSTDKTYCIREWAFFTLY